MFKVTKPKSNKWENIHNDLETYLWHLINLYRINRLAKDSPLRELTLSTLSVYESCLDGKMTKRPLSTKRQRTTQPLELVHSDVCRPFNVQAKWGYEYNITFIDDYSRYGFTYLMAKKI